MLEWDILTPLLCWGRHRLVSSSVPSRGTLSLIGVKVAPRLFPIGVSGVHSLARERGTPPRCKEPSRRERARYGAYTAAPEVFHPPLKPFV